MITIKEIMEFSVATKVPVNSIQDLVPLVAACQSFGWFDTAQRISEFTKFMADKVEGELHVRNAPIAED